eukprot:20127-Pyramimonas_sp.AAC.1
MAAAKEVKAELAITRGPLLGDRHADSMGTTIAMAGHSAYEQIKELARNRTIPEEGQGTAPTILIADANAPQIQAAPAAAGSGDGPCRILALGLLA